MADSLESQSEQKKDPFELAVQVAERVEILNVLLASCEGKRTPSFKFKGEAFVLSTGVKKLNFGKNATLERLFISPTFTLSLSDDDSELEPQLAISAKFVLVYSIKSFEGIDEENIRAFAAINGVFNAWPYWREFVQSTTARMGLPKPITIPVYRLGENPFEGLESEDDSEEASAAVD